METLKFPVTETFDAPLENEANMQNSPRSKGVIMLITNCCFTVLS
jgi:hypothetical protein